MKMNFLFLSIVISTSFVLTDGDIILQPIVQNKTHTTLIEQFKANPELLVAEMSKADPETLDQILEMLEGLLAESESKKAELVQNLEAKQGALANAQADVVTAKQAAFDAGIALQEAAAAKIAAETAVQNADAILAAKEKLEETAQLHKDDAQGENDAEFGDLDDEQKVLRQVIELLSQLKFSQAATFLQKDELSLQRNHLLATLPKLPKEFVISLDVKANSFINTWQNIVHFTADNNNCCNSGSRIPSIWFSPSTKKFISKIHICAAINGNGNTCYSSGDIATGKWTSIEVSQTASGAYSIELDGQEVQTWQNDDARDFTDVKVYGADPWHDQLDGSIRNFGYKFAPTWQEIAHVAADQTTNKAFWNSICGDFGDLGMVDIVFVQMGDVKDYFKPRSPMSLCHFLLSDEYTWSNTEDGNYLVPSYHSNTAFYGGSAPSYPQQYDGRTYISFWGSESANSGGCCHATSSIYGNGADTAAWRRSFSMYIKKHD